MGPTMTDIANELGISTATVSRALNGGTVRRSTRSAVLSTASRLGYRGADSMLALRSSDGEQTGPTIDVLVTDIGGYYFTTLLQSVFEYGATAGYGVFIGDMDSSVGGRSLASRLKGKADGLLVVAPRNDENELADDFDPATTVLVSRECKGFSSVVVDDESGMRQAVRHLVSLGHRCIAYIAASEHSFTNRRRQASFTAIAEEFDVEPVVIGPFDPVYQSGVNAGDVVLLENKVTGIIAFNDLMAAGMVNRLGERGVRIPEDISVIGIDNSVLSSAAKPKLTTLDIRHDRLGTVAMQMLIRQLADVRNGVTPATQIESVPEILIVRDSTGPAPGVAA